MDSCYDKAEQGKRTDQFVHNLETTLGSYLLELAVGKDVYSRIEKSREMLLLFRQLFFNLDIPAQQATDLKHLNGSVDQQQEKLVRRAMLKALRWYKFYLAGWSVEDIPRLDWILSLLHNDEKRGYYLSWTSNDPDVASALNIHNSLSDKKLVKFIQKARSWIDGRNLHLSDWLFIYSHTDPDGCSTKTLANAAGKAPSIFERCVIKRTIKTAHPAESRARGRRICQKEQVRVLDIVRNWTEHFAIEALYDFNPSIRPTFKKFILQGHLGPHNKSLGGHLMILNKIANRKDIAIRFNHWRKKRFSETCKNRKRKQSDPKDGFVTLYWITKQCEVDPNAGLLWRKAGKIVCERQGRKWIVITANYREFLLNMSQRKFPCTQGKVTRRCQELLHELDN